MLQIKFGEGGNWIGLYQSQAKHRRTSKNLEGESPLVFMFFFELYKLPFVLFAQLMRLYLPTLFTFIIKRKIIGGEFSPLVVQKKFGEDEFYI